MRCAPLLTFGLAAAACADPLPEPPDLSPLIAAYERPDAILDASHSVELGLAVVLATELRERGAPARCQR